MVRNFKILGLGPWTNITIHISSLFVDFYFERMFNTVFLLNLKRSLLIFKCLHMSCLVALAPMGKAISQFVILTQTVNNQLLSLSWGVLFFPFTFEGNGEG